MLTYISAVCLGDCHVEYVRSMTEVKMDLIQCFLFSSLYATLGSYVGLTAFVVSSSMLAIFKHCYPLHVCLGLVFFFFRLVFLHDNLSVFFYCS